MYFSRRFPKFVISIKQTPGLWKEFADASDMLFDVLENTLILFYNL